MEIKVPCGTIFSYIKLYKKLAYWLQHMLVEGMYSIEDLDICNLCWGIFSRRKKIVQARLFVCYGVVKIRALIFWNCSLFVNEIVPRPDLLSKLMYYLLTSFVRGTYFLLLMKSAVWCRSFWHDSHSFYFHIVPN